jgi:hypothetical protein
MSPYAGGGAVDRLGGRTPAWSGLGLQVDQALRTGFPAREWSEYLPSTMMVFVGEFFAPKSPGSPHSDTADGSNDAGKCGSLCDVPRHVS